MEETQHERIVAGATKLFLERGIKAVRMDDIASELGVSKRTIYQLFGDRESLLIECVRYINRHEVDGKTPECDNEGEHLNIIDIFIHLLETWENRMVYSLSFINDLRRFYPSVYKKIHAEITRYQYEGLKTALQSGIDDGFFFPNVNLDLMSSMFIMWVDTLFLSPGLYEKANISLPDAFKYMLICFFRGISTEKGLRQIDETFVRHFPDEGFYQQR